LRERDWQTLLATYRLLSRLVVERTKHHLADDADTLAQQAVLVGRELAECYPTRWLRAQPQLLREESAGRAEQHDDELLNCRSCQLQNGIGSERIDVPRPRRRSA